MSFDDRLLSTDIFLFELLATRMRQSVDNAFNVQRVYGVRRKCAFVHLTTVQQRHQSMSRYTRTAVGGQHIDVGMRCPDFSRFVSWA